MQEIWKDVIGYEGIYLVSSLGSVRSLDRFIKIRNSMVFKKGQKIKTSINDNGYQRLGISKNGETKYVSLHSLVAEAFLGPREDWQDTDHIDGDKLNNSCENLQYISRRENTLKGKISDLSNKKTSKYRGLNWDRSRNKWRVAIYVNGKNRFIGRFNKEKDAYCAYVNFIKENNIK